MKAGRGAHNLVHNDGQIVIKIFRQEPEVAVSNIEPDYLEKDHGFKHRFLTNCFEKILLENFMPI